MLAAVDRCRSNFLCGLKKADTSHPTSWSISGLIKISICTSYYATVQMDFYRKSVCPRLQSEQKSIHSPCSPLLSSSCFGACGHYCPPDCFYHVYKSLLTQTQCNEPTCKAVNLRLSPPSRERTVGCENKESWGETNRDTEKERIIKRQGTRQLYTQIAATHSVISAASLQVRNYILLSSLTLRKEDSVRSVSKWPSFK